MVGGADAVHLGRKDLPIVAARQLLGPEALLGATAHSLEELAEIGPEADYVGYGAVYETKTRANSVVCGPAALTAATAASTLPVVAIGGLNPDNVEPLRESGLAGIAVASAVSPTRTCPGAVEAFRRVLARW
jgi:thiamine-phosphate diphosphorylase